MIKGNCMAMGDIALFEDGKECPVNKAIVIEFQNEEQIKQAIEDGLCKFTVFHEKTKRGAAIDDIEQAISEINSAVYSVEGATEELNSVSGKIAEVQVERINAGFNYFLEQGFIPGAEFIFKQKEERTIIIESYSASTADAIVLIRYLDDPNPKTRLMRLHATTLKNHREDFINK